MYVHQRLELELELIIKSHQQPLGSSVSWRSFSRAAILFSPTTLITTSAGCHHRFHWVFFRSSGVSAIDSEQGSALHWRCEPLVPIVEQFEVRCLNYIKSAVTTARHPVFVERKQQS